MDLINQAKAYLKEQGIDQWQTGYPDMEAILGDIKEQRGYFIMEDDTIFGYVCIDYKGDVRRASFFLGDSEKMQFFWLRIFSSSVPCGILNPKLIQKKRNDKNDR